MKLHADAPQGANIIHAYTPGRVSINGEPFTQSVIVPADAPVELWNARSLDELTEAHFERIAAYRPELVLFGSGATLRFVRPALLKALIDARIGVDTMDTAAACRTHSILTSEGRRVLAALLLPG